MRRGGETGSFPFPSLSLHPFVLQHSYCTVYSEVSHKLACLRREHVEGTPKQANDFSMPQLKPRLFTPPFVATYWKVAPPSPPSPFCFSLSRSLSLLAQCPGAGRKRKGESHDRRRREIACEREEGRRKPQSVFHEDGINPFFRGFQRRPL